MSSSLEQVQHLTNLLRRNQGPLWERLRRCLLEQNIDPDTAVLAISFENDVDYEFGIVVTSRQTVFEYGLKFNPAKGKEQARLVDWREISKNWESGPFANAVEIGMQLVDSSE